MKIVVIGGTGLIAVVIVFAKLGIVESPESSRRVLAVLAYLQG